MCVGGLWKGCFRVFVCWNDVKCEGIHVFFSVPG